MKKPLKLPSRVRLSKEVSAQLNHIKSQTQLTPNILARVALAISIESGFDYRQLNPAGDGLEFNLPTLLGEQTLVFELLLLSETQAQTQEELTQALASHIENGVASLRQCKNSATVGEVVYR